MIKKRSFIYLLVVKLIFPNAYAQKVEAEPLSANSSLALSEFQRIELIKRANKGDNHAAIRVAMFYDFVIRDYETAYFWFKKAALNGDVTAQYNLGVRSLGKARYESCLEAKYWFEMANASGIKKFHTELDSIGDCSKFPHEKTGK